MKRLMNTWCSESVLGTTPVDEEVCEAMSVMMRLAVCHLWPRNLRKQCWGTQVRSFEHLSVAHVAL